MINTIKKMEKQKILRDWEFQQNIPTKGIASVKFCGGRKLKIRLEGPDHEGPF